ncbi:NAD(P)-binding domain-containing protein [Streptomyces sp. NPDC005181]|uniref:NAD(P)-binding domain-containing protein n=1 Tax=Streptomyces sp. NPDC005181 TaxID=3156869 RepID=UPI0033BCF646
MGSVGFLGLGAMGSVLARRLLGHGHDVVDWNRSPAPLAGGRHQGVVLANREWVADQLS